MEFTIPCETFVRLASVLKNFPQTGDATWFNAVRFDNGLALACNRTIMAVENIGGPSGVLHVIPDPALIEACEKEAKFNSNLVVTNMPGLNYATAKTTLGYIHPNNAGLYPPGPTELDGWRGIVAKCDQPAKKPAGAMFWHADQIAALAAASPSGNLIFEAIITADGSRPTIIRDANDSEWLGVFQPFCNEQRYSPAVLPGWMR